MKTKNLILASLVITSLIGVGCKKKDAAAAAGASSGADKPTLTHYITSCVTAAGSANSASHKQWLTFSGSAYSYSELHFSDGACSTPLYTISTAGVYSIGSASAAPSGGYYIVFTLTSSNVTAYGTEGATLNTLCGAHWNATATSTYTSTTPGLSCGGGGIGVVAANTTIYNAFVVNGSVLSLGAFTETNPGTTVSSAIPTSTSVDLPVY
jgi:hypothetical protein